MSTFQSSSVGSNIPLIGPNPESHGIRKLTQDDIIYLLSAITDVPPYHLVQRVKFPVIAAMIQMAERARLRYQLRHIELSPLMLEDMFIIIKNQYEDAIAPPGKAVGLDAGQAVGQAATQSTLNTFHLSGVASTVSGGIREFKEIINARAIRSMEAIIIHFKSDNMNVSDLIELRNDIVHLTVYDILKDYNVESLAELFESGFPYWYDLYLALNTNLKVNSAWLLRLELDVDQMYARGITMDEISQKIVDIGKDTSNRDTVFCIPSPLHIGIIDIHPISDAIPRINVEYGGEYQQLEGQEEVDKIAEATQLSYLSTSVYPSLNKITLRGVTGITDLIPTHYKIWQSISGEVFLANEEVERIAPSKKELTKNGARAKIEGYKMRKRWLLRVDGRIYITTSLRIEKMVGEKQGKIGLLELAGMEVLETIEKSDIQGVNYYEIVILLPEVIETDPVALLKGELNIIDEKKISAEEVEAMNEFLQSISEVGAPEVVDGRWRLEYSKGWLDTHETNKAAVVSVLEKMEIRYYFVEKENHLFVDFMGITPATILNKALAKEREKSSDPSKLQIKQASRYYYAITKGSNLNELLKYPEVDPYYTYSNNVHQNLAAFGIEAARNFLIQEIVNILSASKSSLNIQHVLLLADFMTRTGYISKISSNEVIHRKMGALSKATVVSAMKVFYEAAVFGVKDNGLREVSSRLMVGRLVGTGTAYGDQRDYPEYHEALRKLKENQRTGAHLVLSPEKVEDAIEAIEDSNFGATGLDTIKEKTNVTPPVEATEVFTPSLISDIIAKSRKPPKLDVQSTPYINPHVLDIMNKFSQMPCDDETVSVAQREPVFPVGRTIIAVKITLTDGRPAELELNLPQPQYTELIQMSESLLQIIETAKQSIT